MKNEHALVALATIVVLLAYVVYKLRSIEAKVDRVAGFCVSDDNLDDLAPHHAPHHAPHLAMGLGMVDEISQTDVPELVDVCDLSDTDTIAVDAAVGAAASQTYPSEVKNTPMSLLYENKKLSDLKKIAEDLQIDLSRPRKLTKNVLIGKIIDRKSAGPSSKDETAELGNGLS
jgi:hypothetical protein